MADLSKYSVEELDAILSGKMPFPQDDAPKGLPPPEDASILGEIPRGLEAGFQQVRGMGYGLGALAGEITGYEPLKTWAKEGLANVEEETPLPAVGSYSDIGKNGDYVSDAAKFLAYGVSSNIPNMALSMATGGVGGLTAGAIAKTAAQKAIARGALVGAGTASIGMEAGGIASDQLKETGEVHPFRAIAGAIPAGLLDVVPEWYLAKRLGWLGDSVVRTGSLPKHIASSFGKQFAMEAPTETMQSVIERAAVPGKSISNAEAWDEYINSFILGGITGGVVGGAGSVFTKKAPTQMQDEKINKLYQDVINPNTPSTPESVLAFAKAAYRRGELHPNDLPKIQAMVAQAEKEIEKNRPAPMAEPVGEPYGPEILRPIMPERPIDAEFTSHEVGLLPETEEVKQLPAPDTIYGEGFTAKSPTEAILRREPDYTEGRLPEEVAVEYKPSVAKSGEPYKTRTSAITGAMRAGLKPNAVEIIPVGQGFGYRKVVANTPDVSVQPENTEVTPEVSHVPIEAQGVAPATTEATPKTRFAVKVGDTVYESTENHGHAYGKIPPEISEKTPNDQFITGYVENGEFVPQKPVSTVVSQSNTTVPQERTLSARTGKKQPTRKGADALIGRIKEMGGLNVYGDYNAPEMRQYPDVNRVMKKSGMSPDDAALILKDEGFPIESGDHLIETLKDGTARNIFTPDKSETILNRKLERQANDWYEEQLANLRESEKSEISEPGTLLEIKGDIQDRLIDEIREEGSYIQNEEAVLNELGDFFDTVNKPTKFSEETATLPGMSYEENFELSTPKGDVYQGSLPVKKQPPKQGTFQEVSNEKKTEALLGNATLKSGVDPTKIIPVLKSLTGDIKSAMPHLENIGKSVYDSGRKTFKSWFNSMKAALGDLWNSFKQHMGKVWKRIGEMDKKRPVSNQRGSFSWNKKEVENADKHRAGRSRGTNLPVDGENVTKSSSDKINDTVYDNATKDNGGSGETKFSFAPLNATPEQVRETLVNNQAGVIKNILSYLKSFKETKREMGAFEKLVSSPEYWQHPVLQKLYKAFVVDRDRIYHEHFGGLTGEGTDKDVVKLTVDLQKTDPKGYEILKKIIDHGDTKWFKAKRIEGEDEEVYQKRAFDQYEDYVKRRFNPSEKVLTVWKAQRASYDRALKLLREDMQNALNEIGTSEKSKQIREDINNLMNKMNEWRGFYAPRIREEGDFVVQAKKGEGDNQEFRREHGSRLAMVKRRNELQSQGWNVYNFGMINKLPESLYGDISMLDLGLLVSESIKKTEGKEGADKTALESLNADVLQSIVDTLRARGFRSSEISRNKEHLVKGYIEDPLVRYLRYVNNVSGGLSKAQVAKQAYRAFLGDYDPETKTWVGKIDPTKEPRVYEVGKEYIREQLRNLDSTDRMIGLAKSIATFEFLGFSPRSAIINMTALFTTAAPAIHAYTLKNTSMGKIGLALAKASKDYIGVMTGGKLQNTDEQAFVEYLKRMHLDNAQYTRDAMGELEGKMGSAWSKAVDWSMKMFGKTEELNRGATMLAAFRLAKAEGQTNEQAQASAVDASNHAHGVYHRGTLPIWAQGTNPLAKIGQMAYVYGKFSHNYIQMLYDMGMRKKDMPAMIYAMAAPIVIGGAGAVPFGEEMKWLINFFLKSIGVNEPMEKWVWDQTRKHIGKSGERAGRYGLAGAVGVDITGSLSIGVGVPKGIMDLTGAVGGAAQNLYKAGHFMKTGQYSKATEKIIPSGFANPLKAYREYNEGVTSEKGYPVPTEEGKFFKPNAAETGLRALGMGGSEVSRLKARVFESKEEIENWKDRRSLIHERARALFTKENPSGAEFTKIVKAVDDYNKAWLAAGLQGSAVPRLKMSEIREDAKKVKQLSKQQRKMMRE